MRVYLDFHIFSFRKLEITAGNTVRLLVTEHGASTGNIFEGFQVIFGCLYASIRSPGDLQKRFVQILIFEAVFECLATKSIMLSLSDAFLSHFN